MKRRLATFLLTCLSVAMSARGESFNPADVDPVMTDRALMLKLTPGTRQARLQVKNEAGAWEVFTVAHLAGDEGFLKMRIPDNVVLEECRAEVSMSDPFPYAFYAGKTTTFEQRESGGAFRAGGDLAFADGAGGGVAGAPTAEADDAGGTPDTVQESDMWQWRGETLYFFNQLRGLQVFDLSEPEEPKKLATLRMPAVGDQMYLLDDSHVLLLANYTNYAAYGWYDFDLPYSSVQQTEAIVVKHSGDQLEVVSRVAFDGDYVESRLVGERLYIVSRYNQPKEDEKGNFIWRQGLVVSGVDLSDPSAPQKKEPLELLDDNGWFWNSVVTASPEHLLVTSSHYDQEAQLTKSKVNVIPIGRDVESLEVSHTVDLKANLPDKFKLRVKDDILTTVTQKNVWREELSTYVENFDLSGDKARKLDELILAPQERLHATRFDGDRLYVVTFFVELRKDPLFVIDLSDPDNLKSLGELEIPGWSTYLVPEGDRLLSVGIEDNRVAISLFDVEDPSKLKLIQRVYPSEGRSWSEANWDEKAVGYLPEEDLLLVPIQTQLKTQNGYVYKNLMQIVDVHHDSLEARGAVEHEVQGRRATALGDTIVSISGNELIVVNAEDRDEPELITTVPLAWDAYYVVELGDYLWQIGNGYSWQNDTPTSVKVTTKADTDTVVTEFEMKPGGIAGLYREGSKLYVARNQQWNEQVEVQLSEEELSKLFPDGYIPEGWEEEVRWNWVRHNEFSTDVYDVSDPTEPNLLGSVTLDRGNGYQANGLDTVVGSLVNGHLLWRPRIESTRYYGGWFIDDIAVDGIGIAADIAAPRGGGFYYGGYPTYDLVSIIAVDVQDPSELSIASETVIDPKDYAEFGPMVLQGDRLLLSYKESLYNKEFYIHRYKLRDISFADPANPVVGDSVGIPGILEGVHEDNGGLVLFSTAPKIQLQNEEFWNATSNSLMQVSVYDGAQAFLVSEITVEDGRYSSTAVLGDQVFKPGVSNKEPGLLVWQWKRTDEGGELGSDGFIKLSGTPNNLVIHEGLLFTDYDQTVSVIANREVAEVALLGPVYTQNLRNIDVQDNQTMAWLAVGSYGVERLDISSILPKPTQLPALRIASQGEGWLQTEKAGVHYVLASGTDYVGALGEEDSWMFRGTHGLNRYADWAMAHFNPTGEHDWTMTDPNADADLDGASNVVEFVYGTAPTDRDSSAGLKVDLRIDGDQVSLSSDVFEVMGDKDIERTFESSTDLKSWKSVESEDGLLSKDENFQNFYRVRLQVSQAE